MNSLRLRLLAAGAVAILAALVLAGIALGWLFQRHIELREAEILIRAGKMLAGDLQVDARGRPMIGVGPGDDRFAEPGSGLYWQLTTVEGSTHSESLWDQRLPPLSNAPREDWRLRHAPGPFGKSLLLVERMIQPERNAVPVLIQVATDDAPMLAAGHEFNLELMASLGILCLFLMIAAYLQVTLGLRPLTDIQRQIEALQRNPSARMLTSHPREIAPLTNAINALADARETDLRRARKRAGDLAHSLKTPLAAISAQARRAREAGATNAADGLERAITAMRAATETELARTRAAAARDVGRSHAEDVRSIIESVIAVVERTEHGERLAFEVDVPDSLQVPVAAEDLTEILGALIENAARHAQRRLRIAGAIEIRACVLQVEDDGPGIDHDALQSIMLRGARLDEAGSGHGLGLAIVSDLMRATGGSVTLDRATLGGLHARLAWPFDAPVERSPPGKVLRWLTRR